MNKSLVLGWLCGLFFWLHPAIVFAGGVGTPQVGQVEMIIPAADVQPARWHFTVVDPGAGWTGAKFDDSTWTEGWSGFGTRETPGAVPPTAWNTSDIWLRRTVILPVASYTNLQFYVHHDEDVEIYVNGVLAAQEKGFVTGYEPLEILPAVLRFFL